MIAHNSYQGVSYRLVCKQCPNHLRKHPTVWQADRGRCLVCVRRQILETKP